ncbi:ABC transporter substrate-binding protein [Archangium violaceum]|uniref:ABC transporter substrate-binding protein n=1 Tax=Archangium violaceum Cb vi76 TaxID=1406225 RepID=A0A084SEZ6_9BACT|nr:ABC transporter substrate-binding protein [Archangium violaceum]KFA87031.1 ABC transporter substrate-binding protein [Archangium violaceum Cb vi76]
MRNVLKGLAIATILTSPALVHAETVTIACGPEDDELEQCRKGAKDWEKKTGHHVEFVHVPPDWHEQYTTFEQQLSKKSPDVDVYRVDVVWPGLLAEHFIDLKLYVSDEVLEQHFPAIVRNNTVGGKLVAMPWFADAGLLFYRNDLLKKYGYNEPPTTWQELEVMARKIQQAERDAGNGGMWGFVFQAKADEALTCNALEWINSFHGETSAGETIVREDGKVTIDNEEAVTALKMAAGWINSISPPEVLEYGEEESLGLFLSGNAVFMRNWPEAWAKANAKGGKLKCKAKGKCKWVVTALPKGVKDGKDGRSTGTLGGWHLAVSRYSKHPEIAADLVKFLTSRTEQRRRYIEAAHSPSVMNLYQERDVRKANPFYPSLMKIFMNPVARPWQVTGHQYNRVSSEFYKAVHEVLSGSGKPEEKLKDLQKTLERMSNEGKW